MTSGASVTGVTDAQSTLAFQPGDTKAHIPLIQYDGVLQVLLHPGFNTDVEHSHFTSLTYLRSRLPALVHLALGDMSGLRCVYPHVTPEQSRALSQAALRALCGRTAVSREGTLGAYSATCGSVWDSTTARFFCMEYAYIFDFIGEVLHDACDQLEAVVPAAMRSPLRAHRSPLLEETPLNAAAASSSMITSPASGTSASHPSLGHVEEGSEIFMECVSATSSDLISLITPSLRGDAAGGLPTTTDAGAQLSSSTVPTTPAGGEPIKAPTTLSELPEVLSEACGRLQAVLLLYEAMIVAAALSQVGFSLIASPVPQSFGGGGTESGEGGAFMVDSSPSMPSKDDGSRARAPPEPLQIVVEHAVRAFTYAFLSTTTVQHQLNQYSDYHAQHHGFCQLAIQPTQHPQRALLPNLFTSGSGAGATARESVCELCTCFRIVEWEMMRRVELNMQVLKRAAVAVVAHEEAIAEAAIEYIDSRGVTFTAQATMLFAHVLTPEVLAAHPASSRGGRALQWILSFVFGGCDSTDVERRRRQRRLMRRGPSASDVYSLFDSGSDCFSSRSTNDCLDVMPGRGGGLTSPALIDAAAEKDGEERGGAGTVSVDQVSSNTMAAGGALTKAATAATCLRVEYILASCFTRCHPLMTVIGVVAESDAYNCGLVVAKAVLQYGFTLSQTSARLMTTPLLNTVWSTPFTEAMMRGLRELASLQPGSSVLCNSPALSSRESEGSSSSSSSHDSCNPVFADAMIGVAGTGSDAAYVPIHRAGPRRRKSRFPYNPPNVVTGTLPADMAESATNRTARRCLALHWGKCVLLSGRTLVKSGITKVAVPREHYRSLHHLSKHLQALLKEEYELQRAADEQAAAAAATPPTPQSRFHCDRTTAVAEAGRKAGDTLVPYAHVATSMLHLESALPYSSRADKSLHMLHAQEPVHNPLRGARGIIDDSSRLLVPLREPNAQARVLRSTGEYDDDGHNTSSEAAAARQSRQRGSMLDAGRLEETQTAFAAATAKAMKSRREWYHQVFMDSFGLGKSSAEFLASTPCITIPVHEMVFVSLFKIFTAIGDVLLSENPRLNSTFINELVTLLHEVRLGMLEMRASVDLMVPQYHRFPRTSPSFPMDKGAQNLRDVSDDAPFHLLFPAEYAVIMNKGFRTPQVIERWRREAAVDSNHPALGHISLLEHLQRRLDRREWPSNRECLLSRGTLRLLLGVTARDESGAVHRGGTLYVDDLDVLGTPREHVAPRLGVLTSKEVMSTDDLFGLQGAGGARGAGRPKDSDSESPTVTTAADSQYSSLSSSLIAADAATLPGARLSVSSSVTEDFSFNDNSATLSSSSLLSASTRRMGDDEDAGDGAVTPVGPSTPYAVERPEGDGWFVKAEQQQGLSAAATPSSFDENSYGGTVSGSPLLSPTRWRDGRQSRKRPPNRVDSELGVASPAHTIQLIGSADDLRTILGRSAASSWRCPPLSGELQAALDAAAAGGSSGACASSATRISCTPEPSDIPSPSSVPPRESGTLLVLSSNLRTNAEDAASDGHSPRERDWHLHALHTPTRVARVGGARAVTPQRASHHKPPPARTGGPTTTTRSAQRRRRAAETLSIEARLPNTMRLIASGVFGPVGGNKSFSFLQPHMLRDLLCDPETCKEGEGDGGRNGESGTATPEADSKGATRSVWSSSTSSPPQQRASSLPTSPHHLMGNSASGRGISQWESPPLPLSCGFASRRLSKVFSSSSSSEGDGGGGGGNGDLAGSCPCETAGGQQRVMGRNPPPDALRSDSGASYSSISSSHSDIST